MDLRFLRDRRGGVAVSLLLAAFVLFSSPLVAESPASSADDTTVIAAYSVREGLLSPGDHAPATPEAGAEHARLWAVVSSIVPKSLLSRIGRFELFTTPADADSASSAGQDSTDGYATLSDDGSYFILGLDEQSARSAFIDRDPDSLPDFEETLVHEFGHVLSLNGSQMTDGPGGLELDEGRLRSDSYLQRFYDEFWKAQFPDHGPDTRSDEEGQKLYDRHPTSFVTAYAATGPLEDFAETFASFILGERPSGSSFAKDRKLLFFYSYPELVALRDEFRKGLAALR